MQEQDTKKTDDDYSDRKVTTRTLRCVRLVLLFGSLFVTVFLIKVAAFTSSFWSWGGSSDAASEKAAMRRGTGIGSGSISGGSTSDSITAAESALIKEYSPLVYAKRESFSNSAVISKKGDDDDDDAVESFQDALRRAVAIEGDSSKFAGDCSCTNPHATKQCCQRRVYRSHKMGVILTNSLLWEFRDQLEFLSSQPTDYQCYVQQRPPDADFRIVLVIRDLVNSLVSGYLYHKDGKGA